MGNIDFAAVLVALTAISGAIWAVDSMMFAPRRREEFARTHSGADDGAGPRLPVLVDYAKSFFPIFLIVLLLRSFLVEPFRIPSASMVPTLLEGDFILVNKFAFGIRLPVLNTKVIDLGAPQRGDVVVFRPPHEAKPYIKRVVGLPGDTIMYRNKTVYVNGKRADQEAQGIFVGKGRASQQTGAVLITEDLLGTDHEILHTTSPSRHDGKVWEVPEDSYFMMGDNRDNSSDSREWGFVPDENLIGKAFMIWMHWEGGLRFDFGRIGDGID